jgi:RNA-binding protein YhbY
MADEIAQRTGSHWVGMVGFIVILYRQQPDPEKQTIELPA